ncbi:MAG: tRNA preQ1(34) S-adenosylmethionine ribosyltransferase-isomerase QueA [Oscillospiraceae bacterium]|jgi:S-adenosylmethionine:tRNA ribosyltransferase-isomerase|nr:tRNA preQ1(34) S-adenosylmethionine ribosyltransferase-isomerase QueA [Oscillospiraceae bacterium]
MNTKDFDYFLPPELIAQHPTERRDESRMMHIDKNTGMWRHGRFRDILTALHAGDCLVLNDSKVLPARLLGVSEKTGSPVELLLLNDLGGDAWDCLTKPGKRARVGARVSFGDGQLQAEVTKVCEDGNRKVRFTYSGTFMEVLDALGEMPLPPYITEKLDDKSRYQTVYAKELGSAAAPTAGLHFTPELLDELRARGVAIAPITLHVGLGTFRPVKAERIEEHHMHSERCHIPQESAELIAATKAGGGRVIAVGTTCCRTLEAAGQRSEGDLSGGGATNIFIYPGYQFRVIDGLLTNFHLPQSTLIMLVSALLGKDRTIAAYAEAVRERYRFFSFGDCMLIL